VIHAHATRYNVGDDAIVIAAHDLLRRHLPGGDVEVLDITRDRLERPGEPIVGFLPLYEMHRVRYWPRIVAELLRADLLLIGGGELIGGSVEFPGLALLAAAAGVPVLYFGVGANMSAASTLGRAYTRLALRSAARIVLRDGGARHELEALHVRPDRVVVAADVVFSLRRPQHPQGDVPPAMPATRHRVGVSIRQLPDREGGDHYRILAAALDRVAEVCDATLVLLPFLGEDSPFETSGGGRSRETDLAALRRCRSLMTRVDRVVLYEGDRDPRRLLEVMSGLDAMIAMRLHASVLALVAGVMPVAISYAPKVRRVLETAGVVNTVVETDAVTPDRLASLTRAVLARGPGCTVDVERIQHLRALAELNGTAMAAVVAKRRALRIVTRSLRIPLVIGMLALHYAVTAYAASDSPILRKLGAAFRSSRTGAGR